MCWYVLTLGIIVPEVSFPALTKKAVIQEMITRGILPSQLVALAGTGEEGDVSSGNRNILNFILNTAIMCASPSDKALISW